MSKPQSLHWQKIWNQYKSVFGSGSNEGVGFLSADGKIIGDDQNRVEMLYAEFLSGNHLKEQNFDYNFSDDIKEKIDACLKNQQDHEGVLDYEINQIEVDDAIAKIQTANKSADPDNIHPSMLKISGFWMRQALLILLNKMLSEILDFGKTVK